MHLSQKWNTYPSSHFSNFSQIKDELLLLTAGIGAACTVYCALVFSLQVLDLNFIADIKLDTFFCANNK
jgi:hypothetical protein